MHCIYFFAIDEWVLTDIKLKLSENKKNLMLADSADKCLQKDVPRPILSNS